MIQLKYDDEAVDKHLRYTTKYIMNRWDSYKYNLYAPTYNETLELKLCLGFTSEIELVQLFLSQQQHFNDYLGDNLHDFLIAQPMILRSIQLEIENKFPLISAVLNSNAGKNFSKHIYDLFGYEKFTTKDLFDLIKDSAKAETGDDSSVKFSKTRHWNNFRTILINSIPRQKTEIENLLHDDKNKNLNEFKKSFDSIPNLYLTFSNIGKSKDFEKGWSDYALIMSSNLKVCPYCNRQFITPFLSKKGKVRADLDHFYPKSKYPYFSMSLYNLVPSCKQCNQSMKGDKIPSMSAVNPFEDNLHSHFRFLANPNTIQNEIFIDLALNDPQDKRILEHLDMFQLNALYSYHTNHVEDIVRKKLMYPDSRLIDLNDSFPIFTNIDELKSFIIGYEIDEKKINDEPLSKLRRDIAEQVGFIKSPSNAPPSLLNQLKQLTIKSTNPSSSLTS